MYKNPNEEIDMIPILIVASFIQCVISSSFGVDYSAVMPYNYGYLLLSGAILLPVTMSQRMQQQVQKHLVLIQQISLYLMQNQFGLILTLV